MRPDWNGETGCSILIFNEAASSDYVIIGNQVLQSFYATFSYDDDGANNLFTLSLSDNAWPLASLNGYDAVHRSVSSSTMLKVLITSGVVLAALITTIVLILKKPKTVKLETLPEEDKGSSMETQS